MININERHIVIYEDNSFSVPVFQGTKRVGIITKYPNAKYRCQIYRHRYVRNLDTMEQSYKWFKRILND